MDLEHITEVVAAMCASRTVTELSLREGPVRLTVRRALAVVDHAAFPTEESPLSVDAAEPLAVYSQVVGFFRHRGPKMPGPIEVGAVVSEGQALGAIESMGMVYDVVAAAAGSVVEVLVEEGQPVEYGQELFRVLPPEAREER